MEKDFTIWVPTKDRPDYLFRLLKYYNQTNFKGNIFIGDSSEGVSKEKNIETVKNYSKFLNIYHTFYPNKATGNVSAKLVEQIETEFSCFLGDDDLIIKSSIYPAVEHLKQNDDVSGVNGKSILFTTYEDKALSKINWTAEYQLANLEEKKPLARLKKNFNQLKNCNMCVLRTKNQKTVFRNVAKLDKLHSSYIFEELIGFSIMSLRGKIVQLPSLFLCRHGHSENSYHKYDSFDWLMDSNWNFSLNVLKEVMINELMKIEKINKKEALQIFKYIFWKYLSQELNEKFQRKYEIKNKNLYKGMIHKLLDKDLIVKNFLKKIRNLTNLNNNIYEDFSLNSLLNKRSPYNKDFLEIFKIISN